MFFFTSACSVPLMNLSRDIHVCHSILLITKPDTLFNDNYNGCLFRLQRTSSFLCLPIDLCSLGIFTTIFIQLWVSNTVPFLLVGIGIVRSLIDINKNVDAILNTGKTHTHTHTHIINQCEV